MEKITEFQLVQEFKLFMRNEAERVWPTIYQELKSGFGEKIIVQDESMAKLDLFLAGIAESFMAIENLFTKEQVERIEKWIFMPLVVDLTENDQITSDGVDDFNKYFTEEIRKYRLDQEDVKKNGQGPDYLFAIPSRLLQKLLGDNIKNFVSNDGIISPMLIMSFSYTITVFTGSWNWKKIKENFEIIEGDMSYDEYVK